MVQFENWVDSGQACLAKHDPAAVVPGTVAGAANARSAQAARKRIWPLSADASAALNSRSFSWNENVSAHSFDQPSAPELIRLDCGRCQIRMHNAATKPTTQIQNCHRQFCGHTHLLYCIGKATCNKQSQHSLNDSTTNLRQGSSCTKYNVIIVLNLLCTKSWQNLYDFARVCMSHTFMHTALCNLQYLENETEGIVTLLLLWDSIQS